MHKIIGLTGKIGSGKSEVAKYLETKGFMRVRFAASLKDMMRSIGLTEEHIEGKLKEVPSELLSGRTPRYAMQTIGTEWGRDLMDKDFWVNLWKHKVLSYEGGLPIVAEDTRFKNELEAVHSLGGIVVRIQRPPHGVEKTESHPSENMDFSCDVSINNDGTLIELFNKIDGLL